STRVTALGAERLDGDLTDVRRHDERLGLARELERLRRRRRAGGASEPGDRADDEGTGSQDAERPARHEWCGPSRVEISGTVPAPGDGPRNPPDPPRPREIRRTFVRSWLVMGTLGAVASRSGAAAKK